MAKNKFLWKTTLVLGTLQMYFGIIGTLGIMLQTNKFNFFEDRGAYMMGTVCNVTFIFSGMMGLVATHKKSNGFVFHMLIFNIVYVCLHSTMLVLYGNCYNIKNVLLCSISTAPYPYGHGREYKGTIHI